MKLFANGCSFTWGGGLYKVHELDYNDTFFVHQQGSKHPRCIERLNIVWPARLGKMLGAAEVDNYGLGAGSNKRIARTTLDFFNKKIYQREDVTDYLAVIQWSDISRTERYSNDYGWLYMLNTGSGYDVTDGLLTEKFKTKPQHVVEDNEYYYKNMQSDMEDIHDTIGYLSAVGNFFEKHKIPYLFMHLNGLFFHLDSTIKLSSTPPLYAKEFLNSFKWVGGSFEQGAISHYYTGEQTVSPTDGHPNALGHTRIAQNIFNYMQEKKQ